MNIWTERYSLPCTSLLLYRACCHHSTSIRCFFSNSSPRLGYFKLKMFNLFYINVCEVHITHPFYHIGAGKENNFMLIWLASILSFSFSLKGPMQNRATTTSAWRASACEPWLTCSLSRTSTPKHSRDVRRPSKRLTSTSECFLVKCGLENMSNEWNCERQLKYLWRPTAAFAHHD